MRAAHFPTFAQDRASSAVYGMPRAAAELGAADAILPPADIARAMRQLLSS
jgi:chemotaxis response regulator CheB